MNFSNKYKPLFDLLRVEEALKEKSTSEGLDYWLQLQQVDTVIMTGGRGSGKSKAVADFVCDGMVYYDYQTLYTRFTRESLEDSVISEVEESLQSTGLSQYAYRTGNRIFSSCGNGKISFKGIKTSSNIQKANLKSLKGFNIQVTEEAEEIPDKETDQKIFFSIRSNDKRNISIKILNPTTIDHWIFAEYFEKRKIQEGSNIIKDNVMYIHTSYLDVPKQYLAPNIVREYERLKKEDPEEYEKIVMGGWTTSPKGALFKKNDLQFFSMDNFNSEQVETGAAYVDIADQGVDYLAATYGSLIGKKWYITDVTFTQENTDFTIPEVSFKAKELGMKIIQCESNSQGAQFTRDLSREIESIDVYGMHNSANKNTRIISQYGFIKKYFVFRDDYEYGSEYHLFMKQVYNWLKEERNQPDDAPDSLSGLANFVRKMFNHLYE